MESNKRASIRLSLTLYDHPTVDYACQDTAMDIVPRDYVNENTRIYFDEKDKWYYWQGL